jgi:hypothetical protein
MTKQQAPFVQFKDYDHEDVDNEFRADETLNTVFKFGASFVVFLLLLCAIYFLVNVNMVAGF